MPRRQKGFLKSPDGPACRARALRSRSRSPARATAPWSSEPQGGSAGDDHRLSSMARTPQNGLGLEQLAEGRSAWSPKVIGEDGLDDLLGGSGTCSCVVEADARQSWDSGVGGLFRVVTPNRRAAEVS